MQRARLTINCDHYNAILNGIQSTVSRNQARSC